MKLKKLEKTKDKLVAEVEGEDHTLLNLIREKSWLSGAEQASYAIDHPYLSIPKITIRSKNPVQTLARATQLVIDDTLAFQREFKKALKH